MSRQHIRRFKELRKKSDDKKTLEELRELCDILLVDINDYGLQYHIISNKNGFEVILAKNATPNELKYGLCREKFKMMDIYHTLVKFLEHLYEGFNVPVFILNCANGRNFYSIEQLIEWYPKLNVGVASSVVIKVISLK